MNGNKSPFNPCELDNFACPCSSCDNAGEEGAKDEKVCVGCEKFRLWQLGQCAYIK